MIEHQWKKLDTQRQEIITGLRESDFDTENENSNFLDACNKWWIKHPTEEKIRIWIKN